MASPLLVPQKEIFTKGAVKLVPRHLSEPHFQKSGSGKRIILSSSPIKKKAHIHNVQIHNHNNFTAR